MFKSDFDVDTAWVATPTLTLISMAHKALARGLFSNKCVWVGTRNRYRQHAIKPLRSCSCAESQWQDEGHSAPIVDKTGMLRSSLGVAGTDYSTYLFMADVIPFMALACRNGSYGHSGIMRTQRPYIAYYCVLLFETAPYQASKPGIYPPVPPVSIVAGPGIQS